MPEEMALLALSVTDDCNLRCRYCYACGGEKKTAMRWEVAERAIDVMAECFPRFKIQFTGGEPLLEIDLIEEAVDYLDQIGLRSPCQVQSNATLIDPDVAGKLSCLRIGVGVSLDGPPPVNDALRPFPDGRGSAASALCGIAALRDEGIRVGATCVLSRENAFALAGLVDLLSYMGNVEGIAIDVLRPVGRAAQPMQPDPYAAAKCIDEAVSRADRLAEMGGPRVKFRELERMLHTVKCSRARRHHCYFDSCRSLVVLADGRSYVCPSLLGPEMIMGRIDDPSFKDGLPDRMAHARRLVPGRQECESCPDRWLCGGPCLAHQAIGSDPSVECAVKKAFIRHARRDLEIDHADLQEMSGDN
ncbi:MAG TPA: radical SAM protein [Methanotrichaceae archaeon]|nr:radical SAM protein [Methanotrichaceae archaeon]HQF15887.1 radical SAM protein [Methanotrichaceae archaeon]HQI90437.1 radical SAM protein [Methanotrichaceae archaeon]HQJ28174.1 radical SAM protein [Methanotrichaceae archaeon]